MDTANRKANKSYDMFLFWGCFIALVATGFGFVARTQIIIDWGAQFNLTETQKGEILGVGFWPFAISIVIFSLVIDRVGYRNAMLFGFICHVISAFITIFATGYDMLYLGTLVMALGNGTVEAYINPVIATMFKEEKTKWLNILHAGWPAGLVIGGLLVLGLDALAVDKMMWEVKVALIFLPVVAYLFLLIGRKFPENERVAAGVSYKDMLKQVGIIGALIITSLISSEIANQFDLSIWYVVGATVLLTGIYGYYTQSLGNGLFLLLVMIMIPLATTELGTDSWITSLMEPEFDKFGLDSLWLIIYTSAIMAGLRFFAGPIVHRLSPLGLLAVSSVVAAIGLIFLSEAAGITILVAATIYALGKTFFWPTMLGVVSEQFPQGGALTLNGISAIGMLGVGIVGAVFLGNIQDRSIEQSIADYDQTNNTQLKTDYMSPQSGLFGEYYAIDNTALKGATEADRSTITEIQGDAKKGALSTVAIFPIIMLICYVGLILYFRSRGGYKPVMLDVSEAEREKVG
ncbi:MAG: MFS transporter [Bacteroidota bacterium]